MPLGLQSRGGVEEINVTLLNLTWGKGKGGGQRGGSGDGDRGGHKKSRHRVRNKGGIESPEDGSGDATFALAHAAKTPGTRGQT